MLPVCTNYASSQLQYNFVFQLNAKNYLIDERILNCAKNIFANIEEKVFGNNNVCYLDIKEKNEILELALSFFKNGQLKNFLSKAKFDQLLNLSSSYQLDCLRYYLNQIYEEIFLIDDLSSQTKNKFLEIKNRLNLASLQQNVVKYFNLIHELADQKEYLDHPDILGTIVNFTIPKAEEFFKQWLLPNLPQFLESFTAHYCFPLAERLEIQFHLFEDPMFFLQCLLKTPFLEQRIQWYQLFWKNIPQPVIRESVIAPLIEKYRFEEANAWIIKTNDLQFIIDILTKAVNKPSFNLFLKNIHHFITDSQLKTLKGKNITGKLKNLNLGNTLDKIERNIFINLDNKDKFISPHEYLKKYIKIHLDQRKSGLCGYGELLNNLKRHLAIIYNMEWDETLYIEAIRIYIHQTIQIYVNKTNQYVSRANLPSCLYSKCLHPAFQDDIYLLDEIKNVIIEELKQEFKDLFNPKENKKALSYEELMKEIYHQTRLIYREQYSLKEDLIIEFVSQFFHPFILGQKNEMTEISPAMPMLRQLESAFKKHHLESQLSASQKELALYVYLRKSIELVNFKNYFPYVNFLNPTPNQDDRFIDKSGPHELNDIYQALQRHLPHDFPPSQMTDVSAQSQKFIEGKPILLRELFLIASRVYRRFIAD